MGEAKRLGPVSANGRASDEADGVRARAPHGGRPDRATGSRDAKEAMSGEPAPSPAAVLRKPLLQRRVNPVELRGAARQRHDREPEATVQDVEVENVESPEHGPVEEESPDPIERTERAHESGHPGRPVCPVHPDPTGSDRLHIGRSRYDDRRDRGVAVAARERPIVHPHDAGMRLREGSPQR